jgi:membrane-associated protease RseP (regulator of RpoE activity)
MLLLISILVIAHEFGHFWVAKRCGVRVERFGFGLPFGPTLWSKKIGETEYCLHPLLLGGYVSFPDDNPDSDLPMDSPRRFENQPAVNRFAIAVAGVTVNAILGWALMLAVILGWGYTTTEGNQVYIAQTLSADSVAAKAGVLAGDEILALDGKPLSTIKPEERLPWVITTIQAHANKPIAMVVRHKAANATNPAGLTPAHPNPPQPSMAETNPATLAASHPTTLSLVPTAQGTIGIMLQQGHTIEKHATDLWDAITKASVAVVNMVVRNFESLGMMIQGKIGLDQLSSPIRIVQQGAQMIDQSGIQNGLILTALISVVLAIMNLLPIPALDGGHILFILIEIIKGSPVRKELQERFVQVGFVCLLALMSLVILNDINQLWIKPLLPH